MMGLVIDAFLPLLLLALLAGKSVSVVVALCVSFWVVVLDLLLGEVFNSTLGGYGHLLGILVGGGGLGFAASYLFKVESKRANLIGAIFMVVRALVPMLAWPILR